MLDFRISHSYTGRAFGLLPGIVSGLRASEDTAMPTGTIARLLIDKGFGFIRDESGLEHFFHRSSVRSAVFELLREGQRVEFQAEDSTKGPRAGDVRLIEG
jgi:CspA family cold shock protein